MVKALDPNEAKSLIEAGGVDVVDVREPDEFHGGHVPSARNVPLGSLKASAKTNLPNDRVLLVCARGSRSQTAADVAEGIGLTEVYHLAGGTHAWADAGLPIDSPAAREHAAKRSAAQPSAGLPASGTAGTDTSCGLPDPGLDVVVGANIKALRTQQSMSLDELARATGLSRTVLGQIELGKTSPSVSVVWRIAQAFGVHFSVLLATATEQAVRVLRVGEAKRLVSPDGRFSSRPLYPFEDKPDAEFYELFLAGHSREDAQPHAPGTRENLIVTAGRLELIVGGTQYELQKGDAIAFIADVPHSYVNPGRDECWMYLVMTYAAPPAT